MKYLPIMDTFKVMYHKFFRLVPTVIFKSIHNEVWIGHILPVSAKPSLLHSSCILIIEAPKHHVLYDNVDLAISLFFRFHDCYSFVSHPKIPVKSQFPEEWVKEVKR